MAAAQQTAEQKAAAEKAATEAQAKADAEKAAAEAAAAEKAAAEKAAQDAADAEAARVAEAEKAASALQVIGPVAVLPLKAGGERYVYRGTPITDDFTAEGVEHAKSVGLVGAPGE
ncbi:MAG: hypothetical protein J0I43_01925 [Microbacterium sp.]|uniref:hypothetical protein n=1 Tax=Microbacterium sp. TaxID=51671 RepID=UPI001AD41E53|nr:hypothetical protein [Microbacterium sp.]MBN9176116.1 hypothetical protein [Microbacterium sp.]